MLALTEALQSGRASLAATAATGPPIAEPPTTALRVAAPTRRRGGLAPQTVGQLLGANPDALRRWLGAPSLRRAEGSAEIWLYVAPDCALDVILYRDRAGLAVAHAAARARETATVTEAACLAAIAGAEAPAAAALETPAEGG